MPPRRSRGAKLGSRPTFAPVEWPCAPGGAFLDLCGRAAPRARFTRRTRRGSRCSAGAQRSGARSRFKEIARSFELDDGTAVTVTDEELETVEPRRARTIDIEQFVDLDGVDPILFDHPDFLAPSSSDDGGLRAYCLLVETMSRSDRAALGRFVMRAKEYLAIVRAREGVLRLSTMRFADEVRDHGEIAAAGGKAHKPAKKQLDAALAVIGERSTDWDRKRNTDRYRERLEDVIARKQKGETVKAPATSTEAEPAPDLMDALERTLAELSSGGGRKRQQQEA